LRAALVWLLLVSLLPLVLVAGALLWQQWELRRNGVTDRLRDRAHMLSLVVDRELALHRAVLETLAGSSSIDVKDWDRFRQLTLAARQSRPSKWIMLVDASGQVVVNTSSPGDLSLPDLLQLRAEQPEVVWQGPPMASPDLIRQPLQTGRIAIGKLYYGPYVNGPVLVISIPVVRDGKPIYSLAMAFTTDGLRDLLTGQRDTDKVLSSLIDADSHVIAGSREPARSLDLQAMPPFDRMAQRPPRGSGEALSLEGAPIVYAYTRLSMTDWTVIVGMPKALAYGPVYQTLFFWLAATLAVLAISIYLARRLWRRLALPLTALVHPNATLYQGSSEPSSGIREVDALRHALRAAAASEKRSRSELERSRARLEAILDSLSEGVIVFDLAGRVLDMNPAALALHGATDEKDALPRRLPEFAGAFELHALDGRRIELADWPIARVLRGDTFVNLEVELRALRRPGDASTIISYSGTQVLDSDGKAMLGVLTIRDISVQKEAELALRESERQLAQRIAERTAELESANQELEAFSYSVSHDLRAPLRALDGFSRILGEDYADDLPGEAKRYLGLIRDNSRRMGQLVDDLLEFSRLGRKPLRKRPVSLEQLVRQCIEELRPDWESRQVRFVVGKLGTCEADQALLKQVFLNLLSNALKYSRQLDVARIEVGIGAGEGEPVLFVRDNGVGFNMRYADKLFGVFQRLHRAEDYEGTGVGLAIVQRIVHRHGGRVWAESEPERGAVFYIALPIDATRPEGRFDSPPYPRPN
jgi:signal transduction histidine kinase